MIDSSLLPDSQLVTRSLMLQVMTDQEGKAVICESNIAGTLIVNITPASPQDVPAGSSMKDVAPNGLTLQGQLSLRIDNTYPKSTPAYFRQVTPDQTLQEQMRVLPFSPAIDQCLYETHETV